MLNKPSRLPRVPRAAVITLSLLGLLTLAGSARMHASVIGVVQATFGSAGQLYWWHRADLYPMLPGAAEADCTGTCPGDLSGDPSTFLDELPGRFAFPY